MRVINLEEMICRDDEGQSRTKDPLVDRAATFPAPPVKNKFRDDKRPVDLPRWSLVCLVFVVVLSGCVATPFDIPFYQELGSVHLENAANDTYRFEVLLATVGSNVTGYYSDGTHRSFELGDANGFGMGSEGENALNSVKLPDTARRYGTYTLASNETEDFAMGEIRQDEVLLVVIYNQDNETILGLHGVHCRPVYLKTYSLTVQDGREPDLSYSSSCGPK